MHLDIYDSRYKSHAKEEAKIWGKAAEKELKRMPPDYASYKYTPPYQIYRNVFVKRMLNSIKPGQHVLDLGCYNGWFSLELAKRGAIINSHDISKVAIAIAKKYYKKYKTKERFKGKITYHVTDLNDPHFQKNAYDVVIFRNILHHIGNLEELISEAHKALKPEGLVLADDGLPCGKKEALIIGVLLMLLPTDIPYRNKLQRVFRKGNVLKRTQGLVDSKDGSPFEGISGKESVDFIKKYFRVTYYTTFAAFIGVLTSQIHVSDKLKFPLLKLFNKADRILTKIRLLQGSVYYLEGIKKHR